jgi:hypothetical protein
MVAQALDFCSNEGRFAEQIHRYALRAASGIACGIAPASNLALLPI